MAYYRKNKRRFDPRYFLSERMEEELEQRVSTDPTIGKRTPEDPKPPKKNLKKEGLSVLDLPPVTAEGCGDPVEVEVEEEPGFSFTGDARDLDGDEAFGVGWNAALDRISSMVRELMAEMGTEEDEDADPVGDMAGEPLPQMIGEPPMEE